MSPLTLILTGGIGVAVVGFAMVINMLFMVKQTPVRPIDLDTPLSFDKFDAGFKRHMIGMVLLCACGIMFMGGWLWLVLEKTGTLK